uniref:Uncharacterized protein n=1 Tax=Arundo donax TaxID=35708 RepID=A0A0A9HX75_ARUDO
MITRYAAGARSKHVATDRDGEAVDACPNTDNEEYDLQDAETPALCPAARGGGALLLEPVTKISKTARPNMQPPTGQTYASLLRNAPRRPP